MTRYHGGEAVRSGFYWHPGRWEIISLGKKGGVLPSTAETTYVKIPVLLLMMIGPFLGGVYMVFLPFIGFAMLFGVATAKLITVCKAALATRMAETRR